MSRKTIKVGDEQGVRSQEKALENEQTNLNRGLLEIMEAPLGRKWVWWLLEQANIHGEVIYYDGEDGRRRTDVALGAQNLGKRVLLQIHEVCPALYARAMEEATDGR